MGTVLSGQVLSRGNRGTLRVRTSGPRTSVDREDRPGSRWKCRSRLDRETSDVWGFGTGRKGSKAGLGERIRNVGSGKGILIPLMQVTDKGRKIGKGRQNGDQLSS